MLYGRSPPAVTQARAQSLRWAARKWLPSSQLATTLTFTVSGAASLSGLHGAVFSQVLTSLWGAPIKVFSSVSIDGSSVCSLDITGLGINIGALCAVHLTNSDGTSTAVGSQVATRKSFDAIVAAS